MICGVRDEDILVARLRCGCGGIVSDFGESWRFGVYAMAGEARGSTHRAKVWAQACDGMDVSIELGDRSDCPN